MATDPLVLLGPFRRILTMRGLPLKGPLKDSDLMVVTDGGVLVKGGVIQEVADYQYLLNRSELHRSENPGSGWDAASSGSSFTVQEIPISQRPLTLLPGWIDSHTHLCFAGSRAADYTRRIAGMPYLELLQAGGGIHETVRATTAATTPELKSLLSRRLQRHLLEGVTTVEVKTGYGLTPKEEMRHLQLIREVAESGDLAGIAAPMLPDVVPTCLAAHAVPEKSDAGSAVDRLQAELFPLLTAMDWCRRIDIYIERDAFDPYSARRYLKAARQAGFDLVAHAGQFSTDGVTAALECGVRSVDHLEVLDEQTIQAVAQSGSVATALPGASMGLGMPFAPGRALLDQGAALAIATDWNPGSAPMGDLLLQAAVFGANQRLTMAETLAAITIRAAAALGLHDRGTIEAGKRADFVAFQVDDEREILYQQGRLKPSFVWREGTRMR